MRMGDHDAPTEHLRPRRRHYILCRVPTPAAILMSIKPVHSDAIYDGSKTVELRRRFPLVPPGTPVVVYSSSPTMEVSGEFRVGSVTIDDVVHTWERVAGLVGLDVGAFFAYFAGSGSAVAIAVQSPRRFEVPVARSVLLGVHALTPPQSFRYLNDHQYASLRAGGCS